ncbi:hypothetical protein AB6N23_02920 [Cellulomonas sp. 179-A 9B4 NHS]|uniref:hypothetical protein n=1 Tax=Cellulomonas sp. 179-A 9B4 NHS TaxID=3142379 RepID=UPI0039A265F6
MRVWAGWFVALTVAIGLVAVLSGLQVIGGALTAALYGIVVVAAGVGTRLVAQRRRGVVRSDAPDGVEQEIALRAGAAAFLVAVLVIVALGALAAIRSEWELAAWCYGAAVVTLAGYGIIYAVLRRRTS